MNPKLCKHKMYANQKRTDFPGLIVISSALQVEWLVVTIITICIKKFLPDVDRLPTLKIFVCEIEKRNVSLS